MIKKRQKVVVGISIIICIIVLVSSELWMNSSKKISSDVKNERKIIKELVEKRTENQKVFLNSDGTNTIRLYKKPIHYKNGDKYEEIDNTLYEDNTSKISDKGDYVNKASNIKLRFSQDINVKEPVSVNYDKYNISFKPLVQSKEAEYDFNRFNDKGQKIDNIISDGKVSTSENEKDQKNKVKFIEYKDSKLSKTAIRYTPQVDGLKEEIILDSYTGTNTFDFLLILKNLEPTLDKSGAIVLTDKDSKEVKGTIPKPFMYDSSEVPHYSDSVEMNLTKEKGSDDTYIITIAANKDFLTNVKTKYPVVIDPTSTYGSANTWSDSYVQSAFPTTNYYLGTDLRAGYDASVGKARSYEKYSTLPSLGNVVITGARFYAYCVTNVAAGNNAYTALHRVNANWTSSTITWNNAPAFNPNYECLTAVSCPGWYSWNITQLVKDWYSGAQGNFGFILKDNSETWQYRKFYSSDSSTVPYMQIDYAYLPSSPTGLSCTTASIGSNTSKGYVNLTWSAAANATGYKVAIYNGKDYEYFDVGNTTSWASLNKKIWPTVSEVQSGRYTLHSDGGGDDFPDDPVNTYIKSGGNYQTSHNYWFRVVAYNQYGQSNLFDNVVTPTLPDSSSPNNPGGVTISTSNNPASNTPNAWAVNASWQAASDLPTATASGISSYKVKLYQEGAGLKSEVNVASNVTSTSFSNLEDLKTYYIAVQVIDSNGNYTGEINSTNLIMGDRTAPTQPSSVTLDKNTWANSSAVTVNWQGISDNLGIKSVQYSIDNASWTDTGSSASSGSYSISTSSIAEGTHTIAVRGIDSANNTGSSVSAIYYKDVTLPISTLTAPVSLQNITGTVDIRGTASDIHFKDWKLEYGLGNQPTSYTTISSGTTSITDGTFASWNASALQAGTYTLRLTATDLASNVSNLTVQVIIGTPSTSGPVTVKTTKTDFTVLLTGGNVQGLSKRDITVTYNSNELDVTDLCAMTQAKELSIGSINGTQVTIKSYTPGTIVLTVDTSIASGNTWDGILDGIRFKSKVSTEVSVTYNIK